VKKLIKLRKMEMMGGSKKALARILKKVFQVIQKILKKEFSLFKVMKNQK